METVYILGIDISKKKFDAALTCDGINLYEEQVENSAKAIKTFFVQLKARFNFQLSQLLVCLEHTGIYGQPVLDYVVKNKIRVCVEPALQIKQSQGMVRGKTDRVDARRIAVYAYKNREGLRLWKPQRAVVQKLKALLAVRERLIKTKTQLEIPLREAEAFMDKLMANQMKSHCKKTLKVLSKDIIEIERAIDLLIKEDTQLRVQMQLATSVPGVGKLTAANVIIATDEFKIITEAKKFACYAGVAPFEHTSGSSVRGKTRVSKMANMTIKKLLHLAAMSAIQHCEQLKAFYQRKIAVGKNKMSVINAVRNKLISRIFACVKNNREYQKDYKIALA